MEIEKSHYVNGLSPSADIFDTNPVSDVISLADYEGVKGIFSHKGGTTGKGTITVLAVDAFNSTSGTALAFKYRKKATGASDAWGALTDATTAGVQTVATEDAMYLIEILASDLAGLDKDKILFKLTEDTNDPVAGSLVFELYGPKYNNPGASAATTAIAAAGPVAP